MTPALRARGLGQIHGSGERAVRALADVDLDLHAGELVAVMGPSGSGKSTLLRLLGGLDRPTSGTVTVGETPISELGRADRADVRRRRIGYVFQDFNLLPTLTALENVALPLELDGVPWDRASRHARAVLAEVGMGERTGRRPGQLSGGQQQRVAIARAVLGQRTVILADEPTGALDSLTGEDVMTLIRARVDGGAAGVVVTHDARAAAWADRTILLEDGRIAGGVAASTPESLLRSRA